jgi:hypothetical protein
LERRVAHSFSLGNKKPGRFWPAGRLIGYRRAQGQEFQVGELEALLECHDSIQMKEDIKKRLKSIASKTQKLRTQKEKTGSVSAALRRPRT